MADAIGRVAAVALACETVTDAVHLHGADKDQHARDLRALLAVAEAAREVIAAEIAVRCDNCAANIIRHTTAMNRMDYAVAALAETITHTEANS